MKEIIFVAFLFSVQHYTLIHAAPSIESCPNDSIQVEDTCKCNYERCSKPPCLYNLTISINGTDTPGSCCPIYACEGCSNDTLINGQCPCAPGAILNSKGECKCVNPQENLVNNECICDPNLCKLPQMCDKNYVSVSEQDGCCVKTKCIKCPDDSFATNNNDDSIEDKCVCYPCTKECAADEKVVIMIRGSGFPGSCCDLYRCEKGNAEKKCVVEDVIYSEGESWETADAQTCKCQGGISFCSKPITDEVLRPCHDEGNIYKHNESWMQDSCTNCTCVNGENKCIAHMCELYEGHIKKLECQPLNCSKVCPDGYKQNKKGCKICKCNYPYKYDDILHKYNISRSKLKDILNEYFSHNTTKSTSTTTTTTTTSTVSTTISTTMIPVADISDISDKPIPFNTPVDEECGRIWISVIISVSLICGLLIIGVFIYCCVRRNQGKKGSYDTNPADSTYYERMQLQDSLYNNNYNKDNKNIKGSAWNH